jgi:hypothetical protein
MPTFLFTVVPQGVGYIHDLLICLARFDEDVSLEATPQFVSFNIRPAMHLQLNKPASHLKLECFQDFTCIVHAQIILLQQIPLFSWVEERSRTASAKVLVMQGSEQGMLYRHVGKSSANHEGSSINIQTASCRSAR